MTVIKNCGRCGGEHWGSLTCPYTDEEIQRMKESPTMASTSRDKSEFGCPNCAGNEFYRVETIQLGSSGDVDATVDHGVMKCANCGNRIRVVEGEQPVPVNLTMPPAESPRRSSQLRTSITADERDLKNDRRPADH